MYGSGEGSGFGNRGKIKKFTNREHGSISKAIDRMAESLDGGSVERDSWSSMMILMSLMQMQQQSQNFAMQQQMFQQQMQMQMAAMEK